MSDRNQITWTIRVVGAGVQWHMNWQQSKGICYLSANTKLADYSKAVRLASRSNKKESMKNALQTILGALMVLLGAAIPLWLLTLETIGQGFDLRVIVSGSALYAMVPLLASAGLMIWGVWMAYTNGISVLGQRYKYRPLE